eukprot:14142920-Alexandrium_andersonii.AAC.1
MAVALRRLAPSSVEKTCVRARSVWVYMDIGRAFRCAARSCGGSCPRNWVAHVRLLVAPKNGGELL